ncbi:SNARE-associated protein Snapin isoform X1 [Ictidomys tridecemlineatus]|uniref:SNARE-associated protein Snapin isoform X1 n=1 Tax=Urocitellus parryii TaxID=9999 RepID=UPI000E55CB13|nr:SNARE-associated protein Snapin isoform X1 [Urocitellus parryii]
MAGAGSAAVSGAGTPVAGPTGRDLFAEGLLEFLRPAVQQLDSHVHAVRESQVELREQIDNLAAELCRINEDQKVALDLDPYVKKLLNARRRVVLVNNILQNAQRIYKDKMNDLCPPFFVDCTGLNTTAVLLEPFNSINA